MLLASVPILIKELRATGTGASHHQVLTTALRDIQDERNQVRDLMNYNSYSIFTLYISIGLFGVGQYTAPAGRDQDH